MGGGVRMLDGPGQAAAPPHCRGRGVVQSMRIVQVTVQVKWQSSRGGNGDLS